MDRSGGGPSWGAWYWPAWLAVTVSAFLGPEVWALASGRPADTLSAWVWRSLSIHRAESFSQWSALDFLTFGCWVVLVAWLSLHFWFGRLT